MLSSFARLGLGLGNAIVALACVPLTAVVILLAIGPIAPGAPNTPYIELRITIAVVIWLGTVALINRTAVVALRDREWRAGVQAAPLATLALLAIWLEVISRLWRAVP